MLTRSQKEAQVADLRERFGRATSVFLADFRGLDVTAQNGLRSRLRKEGEGEFEYRVTKNTLLRRAVEGSDAEALKVHFEGPTAVALSYGDPVRLAKILVGYSKEHEVFRVKAGLVEGRALESEEVATLATLPTLDELRGRIVALVQAPATQLARLLSEPGAQLARLTEARRGQLEAG